MIVVLAAGCGGSATVTAKQLQKQRETIDSVAAEGALLASDIARDRTTGPFARVHSEVLSRQADSAVKALRKPAAPGLERERTQEESRAAAVADAVSRLHADPGDRALAERLRSELERLAG